jgi:alpha-galactosidase
MCVDLPGNDPSNGNQLWLWECNGQESQRWVFDSYQIRFGADESKCVDAGEMWRGKQLVLWDCNGSPQQTWGFDADASRIYLTNTATCLDFYGDMESLGQPLHVWDCNGEWNQAWSIWNVDSSSLSSAGNITALTVV